MFTVDLRFVCLSRCGRENVYAERLYFNARACVYVCVYLYVCVPGYVRVSGGVCTRECACACVRTYVCVCVFVVTEGMCLLVWSFITLLIVK